MQDQFAKPKCGGDGIHRIFRRHLILYLLLDFDGPVCDIFAGHPDHAVADELRKIIANQGIGMTAEIAATPDPIAVFIYAAAISHDLAARVEAELTQQELIAVATARPAGYVHDVTSCCHESGRTLAVVSNNSGQAVRAYLQHHGLDDQVDLVIARTSPDPALLKPSSHLIDQAVSHLAAEPSQCALVGDSVTDIQAGQDAHVATIGYANRPGKHEHLTAAGATTVITSLADLVIPLRARPLPN
jgi:beta-phosphoglucomutase-like phosphatase (HAD superfamily)